MTQKVKGPSLEEVLHNHPEEGDYVTPPPKWPNILFPPNIPSVTGSQITTGLQNASRQQIMAGPRYNTATNTPLPSPPESELPFQSSTLQQAQEHNSSGFSVIESEIFIPDDEEPSDNRNSNVYDESHLKGPPIILNKVREIYASFISFLYMCFGLNYLFCCNFFNFKTDLTMDVNEELRSCHEKRF